MPLEDYIISVFCLMDELYTKFIAQNTIRKADSKPIMTDVEMITMLLVGEMLGISDNKAIWLKFKSSYLYLFPNLVDLEYKIFNKHATNLWHVIRFLQQDLINSMGNWQHYLADGMLLPICHLARSNQSALFKTSVAKHYCAAKNEYYYGFKLLLVTTESGIPVDYVIDKASTDEHELLKQVKLPKGSTIIAKMISVARKRIETTISQLTERFSLNTTKARSLHGLLGRINRKILSYTVALFFNYQIVKDQFTQLELLIQA
jgi:hypothetical protein